MKTKSILTCMVLLVLCSLAKAQTGVKTEKVGVIYLIPGSNTPANNAKYFSKQDLYDHILATDAPARKFWDEISEGRYTYTGGMADIYMVYLGKAEAEMGKLSPRGFITEFVATHFPNLSSNNTFPKPNGYPYDKTILLLGESKTGALGTFTREGAWNGCDKQGGNCSGKLTIDGNAYTLPLASALYTTSKKPYEFAPNSGLWEDDGGLLLHEWGHGITMDHSNYLLTDSEPMQGRVWSFLNKAVENSDYQNQFSFMGRGDASLHPDAYQKYRAGWYNKYGLKEVNRSTFGLSLYEFESTITYQYEVPENIIRTVRINPTGAFKLPRKNYSSGIYIDPGTQKTAVFTEFRLANGFDEFLNMGNGFFRSNQKGILMNLTFPNFDVSKVNTTLTNYPPGPNQSIDYQTQSWLLDMSPDNKRSPPGPNLASSHDNHEEASLNPGFIFYNSQLQLSLGNVRLYDDPIMATFDALFGTRSPLESGVYRTELSEAHWEGLSGVGEKLMHSPDLNYYLEIKSSGDVVSKRYDDPSFEGNVGIPKVPTANKIQFTSGYASVSNGSTSPALWISQISNPDAKGFLRLDNDGRLRLYSERGGGIVWPSVADDTYFLVTSQDQGKVYQVSATTGETRVYAKGIPGATGIVVASWPYSDSDSYDYLSPVYLVTSKPTSSTDAKLYRLGNHTMAPEPIWNSPHGYGDIGEWESLELTSAHPSNRFFAVSSNGDNKIYFPAFYRNEAGTVPEYAEINTVSNLKLMDAILIGSNEYLVANYGVNNKLIKAYFKEVPPRVAPPAKEFGPPLQGATDLYVDRYRPGHDPTKWVSNYILVTEKLAGILSEIDLTTGQKTVIMSGLNSPFGVVGDKQGNLYVTEETTGNIVKITNPYTNPQKKTFTTGLGKPAFIVRSLGKDW